MTSKNICLALLFVFGLGLPVSCFAWEPSVSILGNYTITKNDDVVRSGMFGVQNRKVNLGFEFTNKFYLHNDYFIRAGLRYSTFQTTVNGQNQVSVLFDIPYHILWACGYANYAIPVQFGKDFVTKSGHKGDFYAGASVGIITISSATAGVSTDASANAKTSDTITTNILNFGGPFPAYFLATADFGASYQPFKSVPRLSMGFVCSIQLNKTKPYSYQATVNDTHGNVYTYDMQHQQQFTNCAVLVSYKLGKLQPSAKRKHVLPFSTQHF